MSKKFPTGIEPIDVSFKALNEIGIPLPSVIAIAQEDFDDASRFILMDLIDNFIRQDFFCIYILFNKKENIFEEYLRKLKNRRTLMTFAEILEKKSDFDWENIPGTDSTRLKEFLTRKFEIDWIQTAKIDKFENGKVIKVYTEKNYLSLRLNDEQTKVNLKIDDGRIIELTVKNEGGKQKIYDANLLNAFIKVMDAEEAINHREYFSWDEIPGTDSTRLKGFLTQKFKIDWVKLAKIEKIDDEKTIIISTDKNYLSLCLNNERTKITLEINDGRIDEFIVKIENGKLNIFHKDSEQIYIEKMYEKDNILTKNHKFILIKEFNDVKKFIEKDYEELSYECPMDFYKTCDCFPNEASLRIYLKKNYPDIISVKLNEDKSKGILKTIDKGNYIMKKENDKYNIYRPKNKIIVFDNSSWILESAITEKNIDFFDLCKPFDNSSFVFHFFTLSIHDQKNKAKIGDLVDGYIDLKSLKENKSRPLRSVGIKKMKKVRASSDYNAYKVDDYGIVKALK